MTRTTLIVRYSSFAVLATLVNLATQRVVLSTGESTLNFALALTSGTIVGLTLKYFLDKHWIFYDTSRGFKAHSTRLSLYTVMGVITTAIFWSVETTFWLIWRTEMMRELGAVIGLSVGYLVKYQLDRRYVFPDRNLRPTQ